MTAHDSSGNHNDGALQGNAGWMVQGHVGGALVLPPNTASWVEMPYSLLDTYPVVTIAAWVNLSTIDTWARVFDFGGQLVNGTPSAFFIFAPYDNVGNVHSQIRAPNYPDANVWAVPPSPPAAALVPVGVWTHMVVKVTTTGYELWLNGTMASTMPGPAQNMLTAVSVSPTPHNYIGKSQFTVDSTLHGAIDDFRIYTRELSGPEIKALASM